MPTKLEHKLEGYHGGVTVVTDHQPLVRLMDQQMLAKIQTRCLRLGIFQSTRPTIKYQIGKVNVVVDALTRSQRKVEEGSTDDSTASAIAAIEAQIMALSGVSMELTTKDLQRWKKA